MTEAAVRIDLQAVGARGEEPACSDGDRGPRQIGDGRGLDGAAGEHPRRVPGRRVLEKSRPGGDAETLVTGRKRSELPARHRRIVARSTTSVRRARTLRLHVKPSARGRRFLRRNEVVLRLRVRFAPTGGRPNSVTRYGLLLPQSSRRKGR